MNEIQLLPEPTPLPEHHLVHGEHPDADTIRQLEQILAAREGKAQSSAAHCCCGNSTSNGRNSQEPSEE